MDKHFTVNGYRVPGGQTWRVVAFIARKLHRWGPRRLKDLRTQVTRRAPRLGWLLSTKGKNSPVGFLWNISTDPRGQEVCVPLPPVKDVVEEDRRRVKLLDQKRKSRLAAKRAERRAEVRDWLRRNEIRPGDLVLAENVIGIFTGISRYGFIAVRVAHDGDVEMWDWLRPAEVVKLTEGEPAAAPRRGR